MEVILTEVASAVAILAGFFVMIRFYVRAIMNDTSQLRRNGGNSVADAAQVAAEQSRLTNSKIDDLGTRLEEHVTGAAVKAGQVDARLDEHGRAIDLITTIISGHKPQGGE